jgi:hypothetical protein
VTEVGDVGAHRRERALALVVAARELFATDADVYNQLDEMTERLSEPLQVAVAGKLKSGKSTVVNALLGEQLAPTGVGERTKVVTWYRYSKRPRITVCATNGDEFDLPVHRGSDGALALDSATIPPDEIDRIVVEWPAPRLRTLTLIDTPGIDSLRAEVSRRAETVLVPAPGVAPVADTILYMMRHLHASDARLLESLQQAHVGPGTPNILAVLSRSDEIGSGRIDAMISALRVARRYAAGPDMRSSGIAVLPLTGLLAETASTLREDEVAALRALALLSRDSVNSALISADRFLRLPIGDPTAEKLRPTLLQRFGLFGLRSSLALVRSGITDSDSLAEAILRNCGFRDVESAIAVQFVERAEILKQRTVLGFVDRILRERPRPGGRRVRHGIEELFADSHGFAELALMPQLRARQVLLQPDLIDEAERLIGGHGLSGRARLGLADDAPDADVRERGAEAIRAWRAQGTDPAQDVWTARIAGIVARSAEGIVADVTPLAGAHNSGWLPTVSLTKHSVEDIDLEALDLQDLVAADLLAEQGDDEYEEDDLEGDDVDVEEDDLEDDDLEDDDDPEEDEQALEDDELEDDELADDELEDEDDPEEDDEFEDDDLEDDADLEEDDDVNANLEETEASDGREGYVPRRLAQDRPPVGRGPAVGTPGAVLAARRRYFSRFR